MTTKYLLSIVALNNRTISGKNVIISVSSMPAVIYIDYRDSELAKLKGIKIGKEKWPYQKGYFGHSCVAIEVDENDKHHPPHTD